MLGPAPNLHTLSPAKWNLCRSNHVAARSIGTFGCSGACKREELGDNWARLSAPCGATSAGVAAALLRDPQRMVGTVRAALARRA